MVTHFPEAHTVLSVACFVLISDWLYDFCLTFGEICHGHHAALGLDEVDNCCRRQVLNIDLRRRVGIYLEQFDRCNTRRDLVLLSPRMSLRVLDAS